LDNHWTTTIWTSKKLDPRNRYVMVFFGYTILYYYHGYWTLMTYSPLLRLAGRPQVRAKGRRGLPSQVGHRLGLWRKSRVIGT
jgi:hypothetical protein